MARDLSIVIPSFNEAAHVEKVLGDWIGVCQRLGIDFEITIYDGGSTDSTPDIIRTTMQANAPGRVVLKILPGVPHGPSILQGYREASANWIFQMDSDDAYGTSAFEELWRRRDEYDLLLGCRTGRPTNWSRRFVTRCGRLAIRAIFNSKVADANTPYRLMRRSAIVDLLRIVPDNALVPNVLLSGLAGSAGLRLYQIEVVDAGAPVGTARLASFRLGRVALRSFAQLIRVRWNERQRRAAG
ncbi:MAG: glycosyltransferase family 2 protein [Acidimicrobiales bacterium]|jgi:glycosyltransferase involved in cell wall biosynthesis